MPSWLVTGGTGSLGNAVTKRLIAEGVGRIAIYSRDELKQAEMAERFADVDQHPAGPLRFMLGDVRDPDRLREAFHGVETVIHAAALKRVDATAYNPTELVRTNTVGTMNVVRAATDCGVKRVLLISSDKACIGWSSPVRMDGGPSIPIGILVGHKLKLPVTTMDERGHLIPKTITGWYANPRGQRTMFRLTYAGGRRHAKHQTGVMITGDHQVLTTVGYVRVDELTNAHRLVTTEATPNRRQRALIAGTLLGNSSILPSTSARRYFRMGHAGSQREWLEAKARAMLGFAGRISSSSHRTARHDDFYVWNSPFGNCWVDMRDDWYVDKKKRVARSTVSEGLRTDPAIVLAAWYQDDGCLAKHDAERGDARLATHGFTPAEVVWLCSELQSVGLNPYPYPVTVQGKQYCEMRFDAKATAALMQMIGPGVVPSLRYKLTPDAPPYDPAFWDLGHAERWIAKPVRTLVPDRPQTVYCIDVEDTHNFVVNGLILHNCEPTNPYGGSKLLAEQVAVAMNATSVPRGTQVSVLRYGNVLGSRGSVLHRWRRQIEAGEPVTITDPVMTRFVLTLTEAAGFVLEAIRRMQGGEIFVPVLPSFRVVDLVDAIKEGYANRVVTGLRPGGEKLHETLIGADEGRRTVSVSPDLWAILPAVHAWRSTFDVDGEPFPAGFRYTSDANGWFLSVDELRRKIEDA